MGNEETDTATKTPNLHSSQEQPPASSPSSSFPDWASFQAYYNTAGTPPIPSPAFFHSSVASGPQAHPYMWAQHMLPPYGTPPPPYVTMYPQGGLYAHPSMPVDSHPYTVLSPNGTTEASVVAAGGNELEGKSGGDNKSGESKSKNPLKRSKGSLGSLSAHTSKGNEIGKTSGVYNSGFSQSGESGGKGSNEQSDANSQNGSQRSEKGSVDAETQNGSTACIVSSGVAQTPPSQAVMSQSIVMTVPPNSVSGPTTYLNIGMDYWRGSAPSTVATAQAKLPTVPATASIVPSRDAAPPELWMQDERELKRQRRKQSNRESARRSRLRKQAEYDDLAQRFETLKEENGLLREESERLQEEYNKLTSENVSLTEKLQKYLSQESNPTNGS